MSSCVCANVRRAARILTRLYDEELMPCRLKAMQLETLDYLAASGPATLGQHSIANRHERSAVWRGLQPLVNRGLVRQAEPAGRQSRYEITPRGTVELNRALEHWRGVQSRMTAVLGDDYTRLMKIVAKIDAINASKPAKSSNRKSATQMGHGVRRARASRAKGSA